MYRLDDYRCINTDCKAFNISTERLEDTGATPLCLNCEEPVEKLTGAPAGYVRDTKNPVRYASNRRNKGRIKKEGK